MFARTLYMVKQTWMEYTRELRRLYYNSLKGRRREVSVCRIGTESS